MRRGPMIITCPSCSARFRVADQAIGVEGRVVRCGRCAYSWHQMPAGAEAPLELGDQLPDPAMTAQPAAPMPAPLPGPMPGPLPAYDAPDLPPDPRFEPRRDRGRPAEPAYRPRRARRGGLLLGWLLFLLILGAILGGGWYWRDKIVAAVPELGKLYAWLGVEVAAPAEGRLEISSYTFGRRLVDSERKLVVAGEIVNRAAKELPVPALRARVLDQSGNEIMAWDFQAGAATLAPGASARFESVHEHPDYGGELTVEVGLVPAP